MLLLSQYVCIRLEGNAVFILIVFTLHTHFCFAFLTSCTSYGFCVLSSVSTSQESCWNTVVNWTPSQCQSYFCQRLRSVFILQKAGVYDSSWILKCILLPIVMILFQDNSLNNIMLWLNELRSHFLKISYNKPIIPHCYGHYIICINHDVYTYISLYTIIFN